MTREGQDGINSDAASMDHSIAVVAYYIDSPSYTWTAAEIAMFPNSAKVRIAVRSSTRDGHVIDCENGGATPAQVAQWCHQRRADGYPYPMVYTSISNQADVINAFNAIGEPLPGWWLAHYDDLDVLPVGALGKQYASEPNLDKSIWADYIPGVDMSSPVQLDLNQAVPAYNVDGSQASGGRSLGVLLGMILALWEELSGTGDPDTAAPTFQDAIAQIQTTLANQNAQLAAISGAITTEQAAIVAALPAAGSAPTQAQLTALTTALESALPTYAVSIAPKS